MHVCLYTVDISNSTLPQLFTGLYTVLCTAIVVHWLCTVVVCCEHVRSAGADACRVAYAIGGDTTRLAGVCL